MPSRRMPADLVVGLAGIAAGATALSRTFLNAHWLSDVVGGFALGTGYALTVPAVVDLVRSARRHSHQRSPRPDVVRGGSDSM